MSSTTVAHLQRVPVNGDEGFPQSFLLALGGRTYRWELYVDVPEHLLPPLPGPQDELDVVGGAHLPGPVGVIVAAVARQEVDGTAVPLLRRRLLPGLVHTARELVLVVEELRVAAGNLNGAGRFGSVVDVRAGLR